LLYITHDLLSARLVTDELLVLHDGRVVERGPTRHVLQHPSDPYTRQLLAALPNPLQARPATTPALRSRSGKFAPSPNPPGDTP
ncbi:MAG: ABC transporter ATP-binding protein, partial [Streptosporangiaceae bacterium]